METEERHELKQNDLSEFFANFKDWWSRWGNLVMVVVIVLAVAVFGYRFYTNRQVQAHNAAWRSLASATSPDTLQQVARSHNVPAVQALARLWAADLLRDQAIDAESRGDRSPGEALKEAARLYGEVLDREANNAVYRANALFGLAAVAENQRQWDAARRHYGRLIELAQHHGLTHLAANAKARQARLDRLAQSVAFAAPATQPVGQAGGGMQPRNPGPPSGGPGQSSGGPLQLPGNLLQEPGGLSPQSSKGEAAATQPAPQTQPAQ